MSKSIKINNETYLGWYTLMQRLRKFEERAGMLYGLQKIRGFCHLYIGQEALAAGLMSATRPDDRVITAYRDHGLAIAKGITANACMAELYGKITGCSKGKGGSMHFFSKEHHFFGGHGIVGGQIGLGAGIAFADKYLNKENVTICFYGDGAVRQGMVHETYNMAMLWKLPVVFICENNNYAMGTSVERSGNVTELYTIGEAYDMPSFQIDGMNPEAVHNALLSACEVARQGNGPTFLEIKTYRYKGHSMSDPQKYRAKEEVEAYKNIDPIESTLQHIITKKIATQVQIDAIDAAIDVEINECVEFAENSPYPDDSEMFNDIYIGDYPFITN